MCKLAEAPHLLRVIRVARGKAQADLASACGVSAAYLSNVENGRIALKADLAARLAAELGCPAESLTSGVVILSGGKAEGL